MRLLSEDTLGIQHVVMGQQRGLRLARGARGGQDDHDVVRGNLRLFLKRFVGCADRRQGNGAVTCGFELVAHGDSLDACAFLHGVDGLLLVIRVMEIRRADECLGADQIHDVNQVGVIVILGHRMDNGAHFENRHIGDSELCPVRELDSNDIAHLDADFLEPRSQARCFVIYFSIRVTTPLIVCHIFTLAIILDRVVPCVKSSIFSPIPLLIIHLLALLVDFQACDHAAQSFLVVSKKVHELPSRDPSAAFTNKMKLKCGKASPF